MGGTNPALHHITLARHRVMAFPRIIRARKSDKWKTLRYLETQDILLAFVTDEDYFADCLGYYRRERTPWWTNSHVAEDILRLFDQKKLKRRAVWLYSRACADDRVGSSDETILLKHARSIFSFLTEEPREHDTTDIAQFRLCRQCRELVYCHNFGFAVATRAHVRPHGALKNACISKCLPGFSQEEKEGHFFGARITGL